MAAPQGNQFWKLRAKHGRDKLFSDPEILWEAACEYFQWCDDNPLKEENWVGKDGDKVEKNLMRPYTLSGLCVYLDCGEQTLRDYRNNKDFSEVYTRIEQIIRTQKFEGAAVGLFNHNIIARDLGLIDKQESKQEVKAEITVNDYESLTDDELKQLMELQRKALGK
jgi:hypothetical protein